MLIACCSSDIIAILQVGQAHSRLGHQYGFVLTKTIKTNENSITKWQDSQENEQISRVKDSQGKNEKQPLDEIIHTKTITMAMYITGVEQLLHDN